MLCVILARCLFDAKLSMQDSTLAGANCLYPVKLLLQYSAKYEYTTHSSDGGGGVVVRALDL